MSEPLPFLLEETDLNSLFLPAWAKESEQKNSFRSIPDQEEKRERTYSQGKIKSRKRFIPERSFSQQQEPSPLLSGWKIQLIPEDRGIDEMAKQIRKEMKAYSLFDLTRVLLEKPQRYQIKWSQQTNEEKVTPLFQCLLDDTLWLSEKEAIAHAFSQYRDRYYRCEKITIEPPKGSYSSVGVCGMSQTLLGPPNHHEYQNKVRRLHAERFSRLPFEVFKSRIQMTRDEALIERWKEEQSSQEIFYLIPLAPEEEETKIGSLAEAEKHFEKNKASSAVKKGEQGMILSNANAWQHSSPAVKRRVQQEVEDLKRFPLSFSQEVGKTLAARGLQLFKAHKNIVYVSIARPRSFNQQEKAISDSVKKLLEVLKEHATLPRAEQWKLLLASRSSEQTPEEQEAILLKDLSWLLHEGYVVNYAKMGFEAIAS
jgi:hypothetical protein